MGQNLAQFTIGIEEEYMVLDPASKELKSHQQAIVNEGEKVFKDKIKAEMHQAVVEVGTGICEDVEAAYQEIFELRTSVSSIAKDLGYKVEEVMLSIDDWRDGVASGEITEIFACGTAAVVSAVGAAKSEFGTWTTGDGKPGPITMQIRETLLGIQHGTIEDKHGWNVKVC